MPTLLPRFSNMSGADLAFDIRLILALAFGLAGSMTLRTGSSEHSRILEAAGIRSTACIRALGKLLPPVELCLGAWLLSGWMSVAALSISACLLIIFSMLMIRA